MTSQNRSDKTPTFGQRLADFLIEGFAGVAPAFHASVYPAEQEAARAALEARAALRRATILDSVLGHKAMWEPGKPPPYAILGRSMAASSPRDYEAAKAYVTTVVGETLDSVSTIVRLLGRNAKGGKVEVDADGTCVVEGKRSEAAVLREIKTALPADAAQAAWNWLYTLAGKGETPHLFPGMDIEAKDGKLVFTPGVRKPGDTDESLWRADSEASYRRTGWGVVLGLGARTK